MIYNVKSIKSLNTVAYPLTKNMPASKFNRHRAENIEMGCRAALKLFDISFTSFFKVRNVKTKLIRKYYYKLTNIL